jgi:DNA-binding MarR family transcriptional regulator
MRRRLATVFHNTRYRPWHELGARLSDAVILFHEALARRRGLSAADHKALGIIERRGPMTAGELAAHTGLSPGAVTGLVDRLAAGGHVTREHDAADRRRVLIRAERKVSPEILAAFTELRMSQSDFSDRYTRTQAAAIVDWVTRITDTLEQQTRGLEQPSRQPPAADDK